MEKQKRELKAFSFKQVPQWKGKMFLLGGGIYYEKNEPFCLLLYFGSYLMGFGWHYPLDVQKAMAKERAKKHDHKGTSEGQTSTTKELMQVI